MSVGFTKPLIYRIFIANTLNVVYTSLWYFMILFSLDRNISAQIDDRFYSLTKLLLNNFPKQMI